MTNGPVITFQNITGRALLKESAPMFDIISSINRVVARTCLWFSGFGLTVMTVIIGWQVFTRYVLNNPPHWSETFCLLLMLYFILFAAAAGVRDGSHIGLVIVKESLPAVLRKVVQIVIHLIVLCFGAGMVWFGMDMVISTWMHIIPTLGVPTGLSYLPFPIAGALFILFTIELILATLLDKKVY